MIQELYFNLDTLEGHLALAEDRWKRYTVKLAPDRSCATVKSEAFVDDVCVWAVTETRSQGELLSDMTRSPEFNWFIRGLFGVPLRFEGT